jgi:hypothetical protein
VLQEGGQAVLAVGLAALSEGATSAVLPQAPGTEGEQYRCALQAALLVGIVVGERRQR